jgi:type IV pilus assembly protein PilF
MVSTTRRLRPAAARTVAWAVSVVGLIAALSGCTTTTTGPAVMTPAPRPQAVENRPDLLTESDEPEARKRARVRLQLAIGYFEQGQTTVALDELKQSLTTDPSFAEAYNLRGLIYMRLNDQKLAEDSFRRAISLNPREANSLHNYGWLMCTQGRYADADQLFTQALANPTYGGRAKTFMAQGLCQQSAGHLADAERSLARSYELDAGNPITGFNLANLLYQRGELVRAQFYIRRLNNSELANAESLWLGIKVERRMENPEAMQQLAEQLRKRFGQSKELASYERRAFNE